ncbi:MAG: hypothetical protein U0172_03710 [Nitrospiraceae bacterium]
MDYAARVAEDVKDIVATRNAIADKLGQIEQRLTETIVDAKETANHFVERTQDTLSGAVDSVKALSAPAQAAAKNPWMMLAGSIALGYAVGVALRPARRPERSTMRAMRGVMSEAVAPMAEATRKPAPVIQSAAPFPPRSTASAAQTSGGFTGAVRQLAAEQLHELRDELLDVAKAVALEWIKQSLRSATRTVVDSAHGRADTARAERA